MKAQSVYQRALLPLVALALAQFACGGGGAPSSAVPQPTSGGGAQASQPASSSAHGTVDEAKAMLQKAVEHYSSVGRDQALADFNGRVPPFFDRDLYVACISSSHIETANGGFPDVVGQSADGVRDVNGTPLGVATWNAASTTAVNSDSYQWVDPVTGQTEPKTLYFQKVGTDVCGVGVYSP